MITKGALQEGQLALIENKFKEAVDAFTNAIEAGEDKFMAYLSRGVANLRLKHVREAISDFTKAAEINPKSPRPFYYRGLAEMLLEDYDDSIKDFTKALNINDLLHAARFSRAVCYARTNKADEATEDFKIVIPEMEKDLQAFVDNYGFVKTEMWRVMEQLTGEAPTVSIPFTEEDLKTIRKWLEEG
jgi:tetratricopeptide (TPR) repeat protein